jgi:hypothetical protein
MIKKIKALTNKIKELEKLVNILGGGDERQTKDN